MPGGSGLGVAEAHGAWEELLHAVGAVLGLWEVPPTEDDGLAAVGGFLQPFLVIAHGVGVAEQDLGVVGDQAVEVHHFKAAEAQHGQLPAQEGYGRVVYILGCCRWVEAYAHGHGQVMMPDARELVSVLAVRGEVCVAVGQNKSIMLSYPSWSSVITIFVFEVGVIPASPASKILMKV